MKLVILFINLLIILAHNYKYPQQFTQTQNHNGGFRTMVENFAHSLFLIVTCS